MVAIHASSTVSYEIPDDWWQFCDLDKWKPTTEFYLTKELNNDDVEIVPLGELQPITRDLGGGSPFRKCKLVPILFRFQSPYEPWLPPIDVEPIASADQYRYRLINGFHRFVASLLVGYRSIPARIHKIGTSVI
jgi:hypothetical protein